MKVLPVKSVRGKVVLPGDKSISHRAAMFSAIAAGTSEIENFAASEDCSSTLGCIEKLGVEFERSGTRLTVHGVGKHGLTPPNEPLDCGNSGTTMRLISGVLAGQAFETTLIGDESLSGRPMRRVIDPLTAMGAVIESVDGHAPLLIKGTQNLNPIEYVLPVASAQIKSCVLLAGLYAAGKTTVIESVRTRDHTERMLRNFGASISVDGDGNGNRITISGDSRLTGGGSINVPSDVSASAFFAVAAACLNGSHLSMNNVGLNPTRSGILDVLRRFGANIKITDEHESAGEPVGTIEVFGGGELGSTPENRVVNGEIIANIIDEIPILAVFGTQIPGGIEIRDAGELRVKESDRIASVVENLKRMGADVTEFDDGLSVGQSNLKGAEIVSFGDHRIAMAFAVAGLFASGETTIIGAECAAVSFPDFFESLESIAVR
jgi:3-phosphoshikimate 1-carboxyvinyltransferase